MPADKLTLWVRPKQTLQARPEVDGEFKLVSAELEQLASAVDQHADLIDANTEGFTGVETTFNLDISLNSAKTYYLNTSQGSADAYTLNSATFNGNGTNSELLFVRVLNGDSVTFSNDFKVVTNEYNNKVPSTYLFEFIGRDNGVIDVSIKDVVNDVVSTLITETTVNNLEIVERGNNVYYIDGSDPDQFWLAGGSSIVNVNFKTSALIKLSPLTEYQYLSNSGAGSFHNIYDINKVRTRGVDANINGSFFLTGNEQFVSFSSRNSTNMMCNSGDTLLTHEFYSTFIKPSILPASLKSETVNVVIFGTSIPANVLGWPKEFQLQFPKATIVNKAVASQRITQGGAVLGNPPTGGDNILWNSILEYEGEGNPEPDIIIIDHGTNDITQAGNDLGTYTAAFAQNEATTTHLTMAGAMRKAVFKLSTDHPDAQIFYVTPIQAAFVGVGALLRSFDTILNIGDINREVCERMNVKIIEMTKHSGIQEEFEVNAGAGRDLADGVHPFDNRAKHGRAISKDVETLYYIGKQ